MCVCVPSYIEGNYLPLLFRCEKVVDTDAHTNCAGSRLIAEAKTMINKARMLGAGALGRPRGIRWEGGSGWGIMYIQG